jgi:hypothetical protein
MPSVDSGIPHRSRLKAQPTPYINPLSQLSLHTYTHTNFPLAPRLSAYAPTSLDCPNPPPLPNNPSSSECLSAKLFTERTLQLPLQYGSPRSSCRGPHRQGLPCRGVGGARPRECPSASASQGRAYLQGMYLHSTRSRVPSQHTNILPSYSTSSFAAPPGLNRFFGKFPTPRTTPTPRKTANPGC